MAVYRYRAFDGRGRTRRGTLDEDSRRAVVDRLKAQGLTPIEIIAETAGARQAAAAAARKPSVFSLQRGVPLREVALFTRQAATLVGAGLTLVDALSATMEQAEATRMTAITAGVRDAVNEGRAFADALAQYPAAFSDLYVNMVRAGEQSGTLEIVLERLADFLDGQLELRGKISGALAYPAIMFLVMMGVMGILFAFVIPKIVEVFDQTGQDLPLPTRILIGTTEFMREDGLLVGIGLVALVLAFRWWVRTPAGRARWDAFKLDVPIFGPLARLVAMSRFARTLATLLSSGVPLPTSLQIVRAVVGNTVYAEATDRVHDAVVEGGGLSAPLKRAGVYPPDMVRMVAAGEQSGELEQMLGRVANAYDRQVESQLTIMTRLLEPVMIVVMGGMVFFIMLSILIPMFKINQLV